MITRRTADGGHLGLFMGRDALRKDWPPLLAAVRELSVPATGGPRAVPGPLSVVADPSGTARVPAP
jgi:hypothetical protein